MFIRDASAIPLPGKQAELIAVVKEAVAYLDQRSPVSSPRMVTADLIDGRVHLLTQRASLAEHEAALAETEADEGFQAFSQKILALAVPGFWRWAYSRVV
jgi:hypothetical protein